MTPSAWMIAQEMRRVERDAPHLAELRLARAVERGTAPARTSGLARLGARVDGLRRFRVGRPADAMEPCCAA